MKILRTTPQDAYAVSQLINGVASYFTLDPQGKGAEAFLQTISPVAIQRYIEAPNFAYFKVIVGAQLAGVVAMRDNTHLYHLFVRPEFQGKGLSRKLWEYVRAVSMAAGNSGCYTVNSTPYAVPVYERFGFKPTGPKVETDGIAFVPMRLAPEGKNAG